MIAQLLHCIREIHESTPALMDFAPWPSDLRPSDRRPLSVPAIDLIAQIDTGSPLITSLQAAAPVLEWRRTYTEAEVGRHFLDSYGYVELFGPHGHFHSDTLRGYIGFWGPGLQYGWHDHEAEELYFGLSGHARFYATQQSEEVIAPGATRHHASLEHHAMDTEDAHFLCYALWKGSGLAELPKMIVAADNRDMVV